MAYRLAPQAFTCPEMELLFCYARTQVSSERLERIEVLLRKDINWAYLIKQAFYQQVMPLVYRNLGIVSPAVIPKVIMEQLRYYFYAHALRNRFLVGELCKLIHLLEIHGIPTIPFKGPVLAEMIYHDLSLRQFFDLDLLVNTRDFLRTQDLLVSQGYRLKCSYGWQSSFVDDTKGVFVDLHQAITPRGFPISFDFEYSWKRRRPISINGMTLFSFSPEDTLLILCIQLARDEWNNCRIMLSKICDLAEFLQVYQELDWGWVMEEARRLRGRRILLFSLSLANALLETALPKEVTQRMLSYPTVCRLAAHVYQRLCHEAGTNYSELFMTSPFKVWKCLQERRFPYYFRYITLILTPNDRDRVLLPLPGYFFFLLYLIRPIRLVGKYWLNPFCRQLKPVLQIYAACKKVLGRVAR